MAVQLITDKKIAETSSKGNQEKWFDSDTNRWYKLDQFGYEGLSETVISVLLEKSNIETETPFRFVRYRMERLCVHGRERTGCSSENFLKNGEKIITLAHLLKNEIGDSLTGYLEKLSSDRKRILWIAEKTVEITGLSLFPQYLSLLFETDALFLNEDRHLNNIAVLQKDNQYDYCPIFDNGAGLLSNTQIYRMDINPMAQIKMVTACPFHTTFNRQVNLVRGLYGAQLRIPKFSDSEISEVLDPFLSYYPERDRGILADRICRCIIQRQKNI